MFPQTKATIAYKYGIKESGAPNGIRTRAAALKGRCPRPLDDGGADGPSRGNLYSVSSKSRDVSGPDGDTTAPANATLR